MITITINHNEDKITINDSNRGRPTQNIDIKITGRMSEYKSVLLEVLNAVEPKDYVSLQEINEDSCKIVEEW